MKDTTTKLQEEIDNISNKMLGVNERWIANPNMKDRILLVELRKTFNHLVSRLVNTYEIEGIKKFHNFEIVELNQCSVN